MTDQVLLVILFDSLRHDYINPIDAPFLYQLGQMNLITSIKQSFSFQLLPAFFAGLYPEECGSANTFCYDPKRSPFRQMDLKQMMRQEIDIKVKEVERQQGHTASAQHGYSAVIPIELLPNFAFSYKYNMWELGSVGEKPTIFDLLRKEQKEWLWIGYPSGDLRTQSVVADFKKKLRPEHSLVYLHFAELDWVGHEFGPNSQKRRDTLHEIDEAVREVYVTLNHTFSEVTSVIFGDHGMVPVEKTIDIEAILKTVNLSRGEDYIYFLDSTQARFWFNNPAARQKVKELLTPLPDGKWLDESDLTRLHFRFPQRQFGEEIFVVADKTIIFPNFFQQDQPPKGMHGYLPEVQDNWAACIVCGFGKKAPPTQPFDMVQLFPTIIKLLDIPIPDSTKPSPITSDSKWFPTLDLSVLIPTFNRREILLRCLEALIDNQDISPERFEILVLDDGSDDGTREEVTGFIQHNSKYNFQYLRQENKGPAAARNFGLQHARGKVILFINDDLLVTPTFLKTHLQWHKEHPQKGQALLGHTTWAPEIRLSPFKYWLEHGGPLFAIDGLKGDQLLEFGYFVTINLSLKKSFLDTHGYFDEDFGMAMLEDTELGYRLAWQGLQIYYCKDILGYHLHDVNLQGFCHRQYNVGRYILTLISKHPELKDTFLPQVSDPLFYLDSTTVQALINHLHSLEWDDRLLTMFKEAGPDSEVIRSVFALYQNVISYFQVLGFLEELNNLSHLDVKLWSDDVEKIIDSLGLGCLSLGQRFAVSQSMVNKADFSSQIAQQEVRIQQLETTIQQQGSAIQQQQTTIQQQQITIQQQQTTIQQQQTYIQQLETTLNDIHQTRFWRLAKKFWGWKQGVRRFFWKKDES